MRSYLDFSFVNLAITPMFLFSATFFPLSEYPGWIAGVVRATPLYQGVALCRALTTGEVEAGLLVHVAYLAAMVAVGVAVAGRSEEHTSELQSLMRISYAVFCLKKTKIINP